MIERRQGKQESKEKANAMCHAADVLPARPAAAAAGGEEGSGVLVYVVSFSFFFFHSSTWRGCKGWDADAWVMQFGDAVLLLALRGDVRVLFGVLSLLVGWDETGTQGRFGREGMLSGWGVRIGSDGILCGARGDGMCRVASRRAAALDCYESDRFESNQITRVFPCSFPSHTGRIIESFSCTSYYPGRACHNIRHCPFDSYPAVTYCAQRKKETNTVGTIPTPLPSHSLSRHTPPRALPRTPPAPR